ncbi:methyltransferase regulatory domain-containing protein [Vulcanococcus limneticus Candia 3F8]|uniref:methyltransferase regulatory domain-containing protein n=1 Tax=Vulcanococcus limneticus TaxID=2170428 RepID=UPI000B98F5EE|nr:methyltransferase regulatory domain-containing protein [Vulcanococcus limneticus]MCP9793106.1 methyltransferase regulatory domain-containing protein [Vulcanococcus limneticus MW73D5]MCP9895044.1 methyltransferase regulatory domain-containing protein [Vulcanococcus limneticus Candia 3F8]MCP9898524.1 methyltransferase regulatory domain-containing protein [Vulcanococcus limneticus Candia 3B3]
MDFQPDHIAHGRWLAAELGLENLRLLEADFLALQKDPTPLHHGLDAEEGFAYVVAHGIATWVSEPIQQALLAVASAALMPGGLFYCSYNTYPGWLGMSAFQQLLQLERQRQDPSAGIEPFQRASASLTALLGDPKEPLPLGGAQPGIRTMLQGLEHQDSHYLTGEYANEGWQPLYVAELHRRARAHKLSYCATTTLPELIDTLLPPGVHATVLAESNPDLRHTLTDLATNKSFRRDLFSKGHLPLTRLQRDELLGALTVRLQEAPSQQSYVFNASFGEVTARQELCAAVEEALASGPLSLAALRDAVAQPVVEVIEVVTLLLHGQRLGLDRGPANAAAEVSCRPVNARLQSLILQGCPFQALPAPTVGSAVGLNPIEVMLSQGMAEGLEGDMLVLCVQTALSDLGADIRDRQQQLITDPAAQIQGLQEMAAEFASRRLPFLRKLGVLEAGPTPPASAPSRIPPGTDRASRQPVGGTVQP